MLVRYRQPWYLSSRVDREFDQLMSDAFGKRSDSSFRPAADVIADGNDVIIRLAVAGVPTDKLDVALEGRRLVVTGERPAVESGEDARVIKTELRHGTFTRTFTLASDVDPSQVSADISNGLLTIRVSGAVQKPSSRKITITEGSTDATLDIN